jgi:hypothetical protein
MECAIGLESTVKRHGEGNPAAGAVSSLSFLGCTDGWHVTTVNLGELAIDSSGAYNGTITSTGLTVEATRSGTTCRYLTNETDLGSLTGGSPATIHLEGALPFHSGSPVCGGKPASWTGSFKVNSPTALFVDGAPKAPEAEITSPTGTVATPAIKAESEGHVILHNPIAKIECASSVEGKVESHGEESPASGKLSALSFTACTNSWHVTVVSAGELAIGWSGGYDGKVFSTGATVETTRFGINCRYKTFNTELGTLTGGSPATLHINAAIPFHSGSGLCGSGTTTWTGSYKVKSPEALYVDEA